MIDYVNKGFFNSHVPLIMTIGTIVAVVAAVSNFITAMGEPVPFTAQRMLRKARGSEAIGKVYVPAAREAYITKKQPGPDINVYHQKIGLKTAVGDALFLQVIATGQGDQAVDDFLNQQAAGK
jgi:hypothetical protein